MWSAPAAQKAETSKKELNLLVEHQRQELEKLRKAAEVARSQAKALQQEQLQAASKKATKVKKSGKKD